MKQSWVVGIVMLYVMLQAINMIVQASTTVDGTMWSVFDSMWRMEYSQNIVASAVSSFFAPAGMAIAVLTALGKAVLMLYPAIFTGTYIWVWWILCFGVAVSFIVTIVLTVRGVSST